MSTTDHDRIITPDTDPDRFTEDEVTLFRAGKCPWQTGYGLPWTEYCEAPSRPGASFGHCPLHDEELLLDHFPDGTRRADINPWYDKGSEYRERLNRLSALLPDDPDVPDTLRELREG